MKSFKGYLKELHSSPSGIIRREKHRKDKGMAKKEPGAPAWGTTVGALAGAVLTKGRPVGTVIGGLGGYAFGKYQNSDRVRKVRYKAIHANEEKIK